MFKNIFIIDFQVIIYLFTLEINVKFRVLYGASIYIMGQENEMKNQILRAKFFWNPLSFALATNTAILQRQKNLVQVVYNWKPSISKPIHLHCV